MCVCHKSHSMYVCVFVPFVCAHVRDPVPYILTGKASGLWGSVGPKGVNHRFRLTDAFAMCCSHIHPHTLPLRTALCHSLGLAVFHSLFLSLSLSPSVSFFFFFVCLATRVSKSTCCFQFVNPPLSLFLPLFLCLSLSPSLLSSFSLTDGRLKPFLALLSPYISLFFGGGGFSCFLHST